LGFDFQGLLNTHKEEALCNVVAVWAIGERVSEFIATRDISPGEELLQYYAGALRRN
jgi:hypothetical protein